MTRRLRLVRTLVPCVLTLMLWVHPVTADTNTSLGARSGEGSTPFTGMAQTPEANLFTGASGTSIKIELPPGRKNMTPQLVLGYSSAGDTSPYGFGWDLPLGRVQRSTKWGVPRPCAGAHTDEFVLSLPSGTVELVAEPLDGANAYRPKVEESYLQVTKNTTTNQWIAYDRSGMKYVFGDVPSARVGNDTSVFQATDPNGYCRFTSIWGLTHIEDPNGNSIDITYLTTTDNVLYPNTVDYGGNAQTGLGHFYHGVFGWESRPDHIENDLSGARAVLTRRLTSIQVKTDVPTAGTLVRTYNFTYDEAPNGQVGYRSLLTKAELPGSGYPATHFTYAGSLTGPGTASVPAPVSALRVTDTSQEVWQSLLDMNHDGMVDIVASATPTVWTVYANTGTGFVAKTWNMPAQYQFATLRDVLVSTAECSANGNGDYTTCVDSDTLDLNGDGIPDMVAINAANNSQWLVYYGQLYPNPTGGVIGAFSAPVTWSVPAPLAPYRYRYLHVEKGHQYSNGYWYSDTPQDLIDMNGDGRPDLVVASSTTWQVYLNTGSGFETTPLSFSAPGGASSLGSNWGYADTKESASGLAMMDFNGDGRPDLVRRQSQYCTLGDGRTALCLDVFYNTGQGFVSSAAVVVAPYASGIRYTNGNGETMRDLADVNGDGLPDWIEVVSNQWMVALNQGDSFEPLGTGIWCDWVPCGYWMCPVCYSITTAPRTWSGGTGAIRKTTNTGNPRYTLTDLFDINGDGMLDRVDTSAWTTGNQNWAVKPNANAPKPNLLVSLQNGLGGTSSVFYKPSTAFDNTAGDQVPDLPFVTWVMTGLRSTNGLCTPGSEADVWNSTWNLYVPASNNCISGGDELATSFTYMDGYFDAPTREFRGFRAVYRANTELDINLTTYYQDVAKKGKVQETDTYTGGTDTAHRVRSVLNDWQASPFGTNRTQLWLRSNTTFSYDLQNPSNPYASSTYNDQPDQYGNIHHSYLTGYDDRGTPQVDTYIDYATPSGTQVYDKPSHTSSTYVPPGQQTKTLEERWFFYDGAAGGTVLKGNVTAVESWLDQGSALGATVCTAAGSKYCARTETVYDAYGYGNVTQVRDALTHTTTTTYDDGNHKYLYPYQVTNAVGDTTTTTMDYRWGRPLSVTGPNGGAEVTQYAYDGAGRLTCVARPYDSTSSCSVKYTYTYAALPGPLSSVAVAHKEPNQTATYDVYQEPGYVTSAGYFDALGRPRLTRGFRVVNGADQTVVSDRVEFDAVGRVIKRYDPYYIAPTSAPWPSTPNNGFSTYDYLLNGTALPDPLGRVHKVTQTDNTMRLTTYNGFVTTAYDEENHKTVTTADWAGRVGRTDAYTGTSPGTYALYAWTEYTYDGAGRVVTTQQNGNANTKITIAYDSLRRKIQMTDPDTGSGSTPGTWVYQYDAVGNLTYQNDPNGSQHVQFCYDAVNRVTRKFTFNDDSFHTVNCATDPAAVSYVYGSGTYGKGHLTAVGDTSTSGGLTYSGATGFSYDARGRTTSTTKAITVNGVAKSATTAVSYDTSDANHVWQTTYPDGEVVTTTYDHSGQPLTLVGSSTYVSAVQYDLFGRPTTITHGNGSTDTRTYYGAPGTTFENGHRPSGIKTQGTGGTYLDLSYVDLAGGATASTPRGRLKGIYDTGHPTNGDALSNKASFVYDDLGRLTGTTVYYTTNPSTFTYSYDALGNIGTKEGLTYTYGNAAKPHQVTQMGTSALAYDLNGNISVGRDGQSYQFDTDDHLKQIGVGATTVKFAYDYTGHHVAKTVGSSVTRYYSELAEGTDGYLTKYYFLGGLRVAARWVQNSQFAAVSPNAPVQVAAVSLKHPAFLLLLRRDVQIGTMLAVGVLGTGLLLAPWRRKRVVGIAVRHGHVIGVVLAWSVTTLPLPVVIHPAAAQTGPALFHYHVDHLGSTQVITDAGGAIAQQLRYKAFGEIRYKTGTTTNRYEYTGYETESNSGLDYAQARFYDPNLAIFLTHDPARVFASPYTYTNWDPINLTDPNGADPVTVFLTILFVSFAVGFAAAAIQAGVNGASFNQAIEAGMISGAVAGATVVGLGVLNVAAAAVSNVLSASLYAVQTVYGGYSMYQSAQNGQWASFGVGVAMIAYGLYGLAKGPSGGTGETTLESGMTEIEPPNMCRANELQQYQELLEAAKIKAAQQGGEAAQSVANFNAHGGQYNYDPNYIAPPGAGQGHGATIGPTSWHGGPHLNWFGGAMRSIVTRLFGPPRITFTRYALQPRVGFPFSEFDTFYSYFLHEHSHWYPGTLDVWLGHETSYVWADRNQYNMSPR